MELDERCSSGAGVVLVLLLGLGLLFLAVQAVGGVDHAIARHGWDAVQARSYTSSAGPGNRWDCPDGRTRAIVFVDGLGRWALEVWSGAGRPITAFTTDDAVYIRRQAERCGATPSELHGLRLAQ